MVLRDGPVILVFYDDLKFHVFLTWSELPEETWASNSRYF